MSSPDTQDTAGQTALPTIHFVSGFLGSGKTTSIVAACRQLQEQGIRTAIVTNDQGSRQVDAAFAKMADIPAMAVSNGCLCCRYDDFEERVLELAESERPDVVFAESVGSCADIIATVVKPFASFRAGHAPRGALSAFSDIRMLERRLKEKQDGTRRLPFSDNVLYIFDKQLEEADIIMINKKDLVSDDRARAVLEATRAEFPEARVELHSALEGDSSGMWLRILEEQELSEHKPSLGIDYEQYAAGELEMAWLDEEHELSDTGGSVPGQVARQLFDIVSAELSRRGLAVAHLKITAGDGQAGVKFSRTAGDEEAGADGSPARLASSQSGPLPDAFVSPLKTTINIRAIAEPGELEAAVDAALERLLSDETPYPAQTAGKKNLVLTSKGRDAFRPGYPEPVHRM